MTSTRTFIALEIPEAQSLKLQRFQSRLATEISGVRWALANSFHITLAFLGDVEDTDLNKVCRAVARASESSPAFELNLESLGAFPNPAHPRTLWVGVQGEGLSTLMTLQENISQAVADAGYPTGENSFRPHVTLGRVQKGKAEGLDLTPHVERHQGWSTKAFTVREVITFESKLTAEAPVYSPLATVTLRRRNGPRGA